MITGTLLPVPDEMAAQYDALAQMSVRKREDLMLAALRDYLEDEADRRLTRQAIAQAEQ
jgi:predicted transcriptional regulator